MALFGKRWIFHKNKLITNHRKALFISFIVSVCAVILYFQFRVSLTDEYFLEKSKCPACYGSDLCSAFQRKQIILDSWPLWNHFYNVKNVYYGQFGTQKVILKKLASEWELQQLDNTICNLINDATIEDVPMQGCDVGKTLLQIAASCNKTASPMAFFEALLKTGKSLLSKQGIFSDTLGCASQRFLATLLNKSQSAAIPFISSIAHLTTTLLINPEPALIKSFNLMSTSFPDVLGACGRVIVEEYAGPMLTNFISSPLFLRLEIAKQLLDLAHKMTFETIGGFRFYMTDVSFENFAIKQHGNDIKVILVDVENILVTDPQVLMTELSHTIMYVNPFGGQNGRLQFSTTDLCFHPLADHNYYAICECILSDEPCTSGVPGGLLWGIPQGIEEKWHLRSLIHDCQYGSGDRIQIAHQLMKHIDNAQQWLSSTVQNNNA